MRCCQNKTSFSWSYRDSSKRSLENNVISRRGKRKIHKLEMGGHVQMAKSDPEAQRKSSLSDRTWLKNEYGSLILKPWNSKCTLENRGVQFIFLFLHILIFFSHIYIYFLFLSFSHFFLLIIFFNLLPLNSKIALYLSPPPCLDVCSSSGKEVIK
jgi:hypothetical protein